jgi:hypothetical protein
MKKTTPEQTAIINSASALLAGDQKTGRVEGVVVSASGNERLSVTVNGVASRLAVVTCDGDVLDVEDIAKEVFAVSVNAYRDFLRGLGHLRTLSKPLPAKPIGLGRVSSRLAKRWRSGP